jgi:hypothetical protein
MEAQLALGISILAGEKQFYSASDYAAPFSDAKRRFIFKAA